VTRLGLEVFAKRVRFDDHDLKAVCLNPKIVIFTPKLRMDHFTLEERLLDEPNPLDQCILAPQGELVKSNFAFSVAPFKIKSCSVFTSCSVSTVMAEEAGLIKPPTSL